MTDPEECLVSIVTPTFNRRELLERTLKSVRGQTHERLEHIVVDGGSRDGTVELLQRYESSYRLKWASGPDAGMYDAINKGFARASGEILGYLNSDDLYFPWTIDTVVETFKAHPEADFVFGDALNVSEGNGRIRVRWQAPFDLDTVRRVSYMTQPAVFWRKRAMADQGSFDETLRYVADCDYFMRAGRHHRFVKVDEFLAIERDHAGTLRETQAAALGDELKRVRRRYVRLSGVRHHLMAVRDLARMAVWRRRYWLAFSIAYARPFGVDRRWSRILAADRLRIRPAAAILQHLPGAGLSFRDRVLAPDVTWLEPVE